MNSTTTTSTTDGDCKKTEEKIMTKIMVMKMKELILMQLNKFMAIFILML